MTGVKWTQEQEQVISLHNRDILVRRCCRFRKSSRPGGTNPTIVNLQKDPVDIDHLLSCDILQKSGCTYIVADLQRRTIATDGVSDNEHLKRQVAYIHNAQITLHRWILK